MITESIQNEADRAPVFLGGLAHSGKTPLRMMLALHPRFAMSRRTNMWPRFYKRYGDLSQRGNFERCLSAMLAQKSILWLEPDPDRIRREFWQGPPSYGRLFALFHQHYAESLNKSRWGDQCGPVIEYADPVFRAHPNAKMIHMIRDPRDLQTTENNLLGRRLGRVGVTAAKWLDSVRLMERNVARYPNGYRVFQYERLASDPERTLTEICDFLGEDFSTQMMAARDALNCKHIGSDASAGTDAVTPTPDWEHEFLQSCAGSRMLALSYPVQKVPFLRRKQFVSHSLKWLANRIALSAWSCRQRAYIAVKLAFHAMK